MFSNGPKPYLVTHGIAAEILAHLDATKSVDYLQGRRNTTIALYDETILSRWIETAVETSGAIALTGALLSGVVRDGGRIRSASFQTRYGAVEVRAQVSSMRRVMPPCLGGGFRLPRACRAGVRNPDDHFRRRRRGGTRQDRQGRDEGAACPAGRRPRPAPARRLRLRPARPRPLPRQHDPHADAARSAGGLAHDARRPRPGRPAAGLPQGNLPRRLRKGWRAPLRPARHPHDALDQGPAPHHGRRNPRWHAFPMPSHAAPGRSSCTTAPTTCIGRSSATTTCTMCRWAR